MLKQVSQPRSEGADGSALAERLYAEHGPALMRWAFGRMEDRRDAEEIVSEALAKAWLHHDQFDPSRGSERAWLFGIARNAANDLARKSRRRMQLVPAAEVEEAGEPAGVDSLAESSVLQDAILALSDNHREVIIEGFYLGRSSREIARRLGIPPGTVKSRMFYALKALRSALEESEVLR